MIGPSPTPRAREQSMSPHLRPFCNPSPGVLATILSSKQRRCEHREVSSTAKAEAAKERQRQSQPQRHRGHREKKIGLVFSALCPLCLCGQFFLSFASSRLRGEHSFPELAQFLFRGR